MEPLLLEALHLHSDDTAALSALGTRAAETPEAAELLCAAAQEACAGYPVLGTADAVSVLGADGVRNALVRARIPKRFSQSGAGNFPLEAFWEDAHRRGIEAERIAVHLDSHWAGEAYCPAFLQDIGRPLLALLSPEQYEKAQGNAFARGLHVLEAEQAEFGADHTLAGKWLAEAWGLPRACIDVIWLHHHAPAALEGLGRTRSLLDIVGVAEHLVNRGAAGEIPSSALPPRLAERLERLGIDEAQLDAWAAAAPVARAPAARLRKNRPAQAIKPLEAPVARRYEALRGLLLDGAHGGDPVTVLNAIASAVRNAFQAPAGLCFMVSDTPPAVDACIWRDLDQAIDTIRMPLDGGNSVAEKNAVLARLLARLGEGVRSPLTHQGLITLPMCSGGKSYGQIVLDFSVVGTAPSQETVTELYRFSEICGAMLARQNLHTEAVDKAEQLATALWKQEASIQQRLHAERLAGVSQLAAGAAHEINNPLAVISGRAQILLSRAHGEEDSKALDTIVRQSRRVTQILRDLMQFARSAKPKYESVLVSYVLHQLLASQRERFAAKGIRIVEDYEKNVPRVRLDPQQMMQVFLNIFLNAEQAMARPRGRTSNAGGVLTVRLCAHGGSVEIRIEDNGPGIPASIIGEVFDPFFTTKDVGGGTGLGLAVCHGIVEGHGGRIRIDSAAGRGCTVTITLPTVHTAESRNAPISVVENFEPTAAKAHGKPRILLAEADEDLAAILEETIGQRGFEMRGARNGLDALAILAAGGADLLVAAHGLTASEGTPLFDEVRARFPEIPVIVLAGPIDGAEPGEMLRRGAVACLRKPFEMARLLAEIRLATAVRDVA